MVQGLVIVSMMTLCLDVSLDQAKQVSHNVLELCGKGVVAQFPPAWSDDTTMYGYLDDTGSMPTHYYSVNSKNGWTWVVPRDGRVRHASTVLRIDQKASPTTENAITKDQAEEFLTRLTNASGREGQAIELERRFTGSPEEGYQLVVNYWWSVRGYRFEGNQGIATMEPATGRVYEVYFPQEWQAPTDWSNTLTREEARAKAEAELRKAGATDPEIGATECVISMDEEGCAAYNDRPAFLRKGLDETPVGVLAWITYASDPDTDPTNFGYRVAIRASDGSVLWVRKPPKT